MADKNLLSQMLESLVNDEQAKAEELFHEYVVAKSREIYETLIESEMEEDDEEEVEEGAEEDEEEKVEEAFGDEGDDAGFGGDATDDLEGDLEGGDEMGGDEFGGEAESEEEIMQDLGDIIDELQAKFDALTGSEEEQGEFGDEGEEDMGGDEFGAEDEPEEEGFDLATVREYVEKVPAGHGAERKGGAEGQLSGTGAQGNKPTMNTKSIVAGKNDMGGTTANILSGRNGAEASVAGAAGGPLKGSGLLKGKTQEENFGNVNVPGGNAGKTGFKKKEPGHGAEKKGAAEGSTEAQSLFRGRR
jgi:hypothetical protein